jgi:putative transposase
MLVLEYKLIPSEAQTQRIEEAIRAFQFVRNKCLRLWIDTNAKPYELYRLCAVLAKEFDFARALDAQARQAASERASYAISRYLKPDKSGRRLKYPRFQKNNRSVEYKLTGWKLSEDRRRVTFRDGIGIGTMKMLGTQDLCPYDLSLIKRVRILRRADMYFVQFCIAIDRSEPQEPTGKTIGLDMGLKSFFTDSDGNSVSCPKPLRKAEKRLRREQRRLSRKQKGGKNRRKSRIRVARRHLKVQRQRKDFAVKLARCVVKSNDFVAMEDLQVKNLVRNRHLAKSISDAAWSLFAGYVCYFGQVFGKPVVKVAPAYTSQGCSNPECGHRVKKSLSERTHVCPKCGLVMDRDENAARNILRLGLELVSETYPGAPENVLARKSEGTPGETAPLLPAQAG